MNREDLDPGSTPWADRFDAAVPRVRGAQPGELMRLAMELATRGEPYALVTVVRAVAPTSTHVGAQAIVRGDGAVHGWIGGGCARTVVVNAALDTIAHGVPRMIRIANDACEVPADIERHRMPCASNGEIELFIHPQIAAPLLLVLGSTPVAAAARNFAREVGFSVTEDADGQPLLALVATQGDGDEAALQAALMGSARRVMFIASAAKAKKMRETLHLLGMSQERLDRLEAPAGADIGARTPSEIALAVIAGAVAWRRAAERKAPRASERDTARATVSPIPPDVGRPYVNPVCGMKVDPAQARHTVVYEGERLFFCCDGCRDEFKRAPAKYAALQAQSRSAPPAQSRS